MQELYVLGRKAGDRLEFLSVATSGSGVRSFSRNLDDAIPCYKRQGKEEFPDYCVSKHPSYRKARRGLRLYKVVTVVKATRKTFK